MGNSSGDDIEISVREGKEPLWVRHPDQDVAVLELGLAEDTEVKALPVSVLAKDPAAVSAHYTVGTDVWVLGYPTRFEVNKAGFAACARRGLRGELPGDPDRQAPDRDHRLHHLRGATAAARCSPGGTATRSYRWWSALVVSQFWHTEKLETFSGKQTINHSLGLARPSRKQG